MNTIAALTIAAIATMTISGSAQEPATRPIADALGREAARLAGVPQRSATNDGWSRVRSLSAGATIYISTDTLGRSRRMLVDATDERIVVYAPANPLVPASARGDIAAAIAHEPERFREAALGHIALSVQNVEFSRDGVIVDGQRTGDLSDALMVVPRKDVSRVERERRSGSASAAIAGGAIGLIAGPFIGAALDRATGPCSCDDPGLAGAILGLWIGVPVGAIGMYALTSHTVGELIYARAPNEPGEGFTPPGRD
jgi:hypothetical protein